VKGNTAERTDTDALTRLLATEPVRRVVGRNRTKADIVVYADGSSAIAVKDYSPRSFLVRHLLGRWLIRREARAYRAAGGAPGLPRWLGRVGPFALAVGWVDAEPLSRRTRGEGRALWFDRLDAIVGDLHDRGVALGDLHHRDVLVGADDRVWVVDLATAWVIGPRTGALGRRWFERFAAQDRIAAARLRARYTGGDPDHAIEIAGPRAAARYRRGRRLRRWLDRLRRKNRGA
jgi:hypothetical protein